MTPSVGPPRTLPIRVAPVPGEAIDSWLETVAARTHTAWGDILAAVGLHNDDRRPYPPWAITLADRELEHLQIATQTDNSVELTLQRYHGTAVLIDPETHQLTSAAPWTRRAGSRFCPYCLDDNHGRWPLQWRLGWAFACPLHHCLLADACPTCGRAPRSRAYPSDRTPRPGRCPNPSLLEKGRGRSAPRCDTDLTTAPVTTFSSDHPVIRAQSLINQIIDEGSAQFGVYAKSPQPAMKVLGDIRAIAGRVLHFAAERDLARRLPAHLLTAAAPDNAPEYVPEGMRTVLFTKAFDLGAKPALDAPAKSATTAIAVHAALDVLDREDMAAAGITYGGSSLRATTLNTASDPQPCGAETPPRLCSPPSRSPASHQEWRPPINYDIGREASFPDDHHWDPMQISTFVWSQLNSGQRSEISLQHRTPGAPTSTEPCPRHSTLSAPAPHSLTPHSAQAATSAATHCQDFSSSWKLIPTGPPSAQR